MMDQISRSIIFIKLFSELLAYKYDNKVSVKKKVWHRNV